MVRKISQTLFDLKAIGTRASTTRFFSSELSWWSDLDGDLLGTVILDLTDQDFGWIMLMKDLSGRFRCIDIGVNFPNQRIAEARLREQICLKTVEIGFERHSRQGDEPNDVFDVLDIGEIPDNKLHKYFRILTEESSHQPAMEVIRSISPWFSTSDPNFKKEFQQTQFDQRLWEIYLWTVLRNQGFDVEHCEAPDLIISDSYYRMAIEATTVAPSQGGILAKHPEPKTIEDIQEFLKDYMPMKFGSPLKSKLEKTDKEGKHYWEREDTKGIPFIIAIADFHKESADALPGTMTYTRPALFAYLYGQRIDIELIDGALKPKVVKVNEHRFKAKKIPSGFFDLPKSEFVSAIIFSNAGTISKFNRMGVLAGYKPEGHHFFRMGYRFDPTPGAMEGVPFSIDITDSSYTENWADELEVFHNPNAKFPLDVEAFPAAAHFWIEDGEPRMIEHHGRVLQSVTNIFFPENSTKVAKHLKVIRL